MANPFEVDHDGISALARSSAVGDQMVAAAEAAIPYAQSISPVETGEYRSSFVARPADVRVSGERRAGAVLENTSDHAVAVEFIDGKHVLARTVDVIERGH